MSDLTEAELAEIERRAAFATGGPWAADYERLAVFTSDLRTLVYVLIDGPESRTHHPRANADADFIAAARTDVPRLVAALRAAYAERDLAKAEPAQAQTGGCCIEYGVFQDCTSDGFGHAFIATRYDRAAADETVIRLQAEHPDYPAYAKKRVIHHSEWQPVEDVSAPLPRRGGPDGGG